jgi:Uncharacterised protein family (UPF0175)
MQVTVEMPDQVARQWGETPDTVARHVMEDAAIEGYRAGRLTQRQVGAMLGLDYWQTETFLSERAVLAHSCKCELALAGRSINGSSLGHRHEQPILGHDACHQKLQWHGEDC